MFAQKRCLSDECRDIQSPPKQRFKSDSYFLLGFLRPIVVRQQCNICYVTLLETNRVPA